MPKPKPYESNKDYTKRCMSDSEMKSKHPDFNERYAVCQAFYTELETSKTSFDYDGTLSTEKGKQIAHRVRDNVYIISAREDKVGMVTVAKELGIPLSRVYATGSNKAKIEKIKELGITTHYDNNPDIVKQLGSIGKLI